MAAIALGCLLLFSVLAFASTEQWALSTFQVGIGLMGLCYAFRGKLRWHPLVIPLAAIFVCAVTQLMAGSTVYRFPTERALLNWGVYLLLFMVVLQVLAEAKIRSQFLLAISFAGGAIAVISTVQYFTAEGAIYWMFRPRAGRAFGPFVNPDHYAAFVELILPVVLYHAYRDRRRAWLHIALAAILFGSVIASVSRAGAVLVTAELVIVPVVVIGRRAGRMVAITAVCACLASAVVGWDKLWIKLQNDNPFRYRREIFGSTVQMIRQRPWTGFGLGTYSTVYPEFASFDTGLSIDHAHNDWAEWTAEGGIPMLLLMLGFAVASFRPALRSGWGLGIHIVLLHSLVDFPLQIPAIAALVFALAAAVASKNCVIPNSPVAHSRGFRIRQSCSTNSGGEGREEPARRSAELPLGFLDGRAGGGSDPPSAAGDRTAPVSIAFLKSRPM